MSVSSFTLIFGQADSPTLNLVAAVVTQWPQMTNQMTQMTQKMTQHDWKIKTASQFMSVSSFMLIFGQADSPTLNLVAAVVTQWPQMTNQMIQMTQMTHKMTQHVWHWSIHECE